jgi:hypothetical protein
MTDAPAPVPANQMFSPENRRLQMQKAIENFLFGIFFGMGFSIANNVLNFIGQFLHASH